MQITFPKYSGLRCLMMPYIQGEPLSVPNEYAAYSEILRSVFIRRGDVGYLTIDESPAIAGKPHRGKRAKYGRALHTEAGLRWNLQAGWGAWSEGNNVTLEPTVEVLLANSIDRTCAVWTAQHSDTSDDGDIGYAAEQYPYQHAVILKAGEVGRIGIFTPHESLPVAKDVRRQFLRIISSGVHGREPYFTKNPLMEG